MSDISITVTDDAGSFQVPFSKLALTRDIFNPAREISLEFPQPEWRGEARSLIFKSPSFTETFLIDKHAYSKNRQGIYQSIKGRSKLGATLLDSEVYPCSLENVDLAALIKEIAAIYGVSSFKVPIEKTIGLFVIADNESVWDAISSFVRLAYGKKVYLLEDNSIYVGDPNGKQFITYSNIGESAVKYSTFSYESIPEERVKEIWALDEEGSRNLHQNIFDTNSRKIKYMRSPTGYNQAPIHTPTAQIVQSMWKSHKILLRVPGFFLGAPNDMAYFPDFKILGLWQLEKGTWKWDDGWYTDLEFRMKNYRGE